MTDPYVSHGRALVMLQEAQADNERLRGLLRDECDDADRLLRHFGLDPERYRTEAGFLNVPKIAAAIKYPDDYPRTTVQPNAVLGAPKDEEPLYKWRFRNGDVCGFYTAAQIRELAQRDGYSEADVDRMLRAADPPSQPSGDCGCSQYEFCIDKPNCKRAASPTTDNLKKHEEVLKDG